MLELLLCVAEVSRTRTEFIFYFSYQMYKMVAVFVEQDVGEQMAQNLQLKAAAGLPYLAMGSRQCNSVLFCFCLKVSFTHYLQGQKLLTYIVIQSDVTNCFKKSRTRIFWIAFTDWWKYSLKISKVKGSTGEWRLYVQLPPFSPSKLSWDCCDLKPRELTLRWLMQHYPKYFLHLIEHLL